ncbi:hypothetical protein BJ875DRAFT_365607 [Amylocarpus encephaloides]|uniref:FAD-binding PCMH-type domain-containing protein n=1 Tax=Amylocarpus encephaloides TaxID=45428 RepID=A0A9P7YTP4_9HELO|nr:hypothetical protein BJ875DRAFT_365607 [Amylocarpus encephaloides]
MVTINGVTGPQFTISTKGYEDRQYQYASTSYETENRIKPGLIVYPKDKSEIAKTILYAKSQKVAVAIRTGGHQYSGASSTIAPNIQIDLKKAFRGPDDRQIFKTENQTFVRTSVSWPLGDFNKFLGDNKIFIPHGQCQNVHLGGHVQSGGWGQLGRSFGLFGDHVVSIEIVDHEGNFKEVTTQNDPDLFFALMGGSPGNLGVITHFTVKVHRDEDYVGSRGLKSIFLYKPKILKRLLDQLVEMSDDENFPGNYDFCVSVLSSANKLLDWFPEADGEMRKENPEIFGEDGVPLWPRSIIVYAQWVPLNKGDKPDMTWFDRIKEDSLFNLPSEVKPMSELTSQWIFRNVREFDHPYIKSTQVTNSKTLAADGWVDWMVERLDGIIKPQANRLWISAQFQNFGGKNSAFTKNAGNGTSHSFRDSTICATVDCFYGKGHKQSAEDWHDINALEGLGPKGKFCKEDKRVLWGSYGEYDLDKVWNCYFDDREKYEKLKKIRASADPDGVFTPNSFSVKRD